MVHNLSPMTNLSVDPVSRRQPADGWGTRRIWIAGAFGAMLAGSPRILDFWSLGAGGSLSLGLRGLFELSQVLFLLPLAGFVVGLLIAAGIALWHRYFRRLASSIFAIAAIPVCFMTVAKVPLFDPWLWYAIANSTRFEALAGSDPPRTDRNTRRSKSGTYQPAWLASVLIILSLLFTMRAMLSALSRLNGQAFGGPELCSAQHLSLGADDCTAIFSGWTNLNSTDV